MAGLEDIFLPIALSALAALPFEIRLLARQRDRAQARFFLKYREYVRLWIVAGAILTPGFLLMLVAAVMDRAEPAWPWGLLSMAAMAIALYGCSGVLRALREAKS